MRRRALPFFPFFPVELEYLLYRRGRRCDFSLQRRIGSRDTGARRVPRYPIEGCEKRKERLLVCGRSNQSDWLQCGDVKEEGWESL